MVKKKKRIVLGIGYPLVDYVRNMDNDDRAVCLIRNRNIDDGPSVFLAALPRIMNPQKKYCLVLEEVL